MVADPQQASIVGRDRARGLDPASRAEPAQAAQLADLGAVRLNRR